MRRQSRNRNKQFMDIETPHDGFCCDFVNKIFYRKARGSAAQFYANIENLATIGSSSGDTKKYVDSDGIIKQRGVTNSVRYDYDPATLMPRGFLSEGSTTNICLQSQTFDNASWVKTNTTISTNTTTDPENASAADSLVDSISAASVFTLSQSITFLNSTHYNFSIWAKANTSNWIYIELPASAFTSAVRTYFNVSTGVVGTSSGLPLTARIEAYVNGWYRISISKISTAAAAGNILIGLGEADNDDTYTGLGTGQMYIWGAQVAVNDAPSSYIVTTGSSANHGVESCTITPQSSGEINTQEGTCLIEFMLPYATAVHTNVRYFLAWSSGSPMHHTNASTAMRTTDGTNSISINVGAPAYTFSRYASSYGAGRQNIIGITTSGLTKVVDQTFDFAMGTFPITSYWISGASANGNPGTGSIAWVRKIEYWPYQLPNAILQAWVSKGALL